MPDPEVQLADLLAVFPAEKATLGAALRTKLRARLPGLTEIVYFYENQGALVISYSPSQHGYEGVCSLSVYADRVLLHFAKGATLAAADPAKLLQGRATARHVALGAVTDLDRPEVEALVVAALELAGVRPVAGAVGAVLFKVEGQKARAGRARSRG